MKKILLGLLFIAAVLFLFFFHAGQIPLWSSDEGRFGEIAREMWESKNFVIPTFNGIIYLDKPILAPLLTSLSYGTFGVSALSTRLFPILSALLGLLTVFLFVRKLFDPKTAAYAAIILTTTFGYVMVGRFAVIDMIMTFLLTVCLFSLLTAYLSKQSRYYLLAYLFMGLAFLTKGLFGIVIPGLIFFVFLLWQKDLGEIKKMRLGWGVVIVAVICLPWIIAAAAQKSDFLRVFFWEQQFGRFLTGSFGRKRPLWFFVPILFATSFPWSLFLPSAIVNGLKKENPYRTSARFLVCWIATTFIFFSIPKSKLPYYLLPISAAVATLIAGLFSSWGSRFTASLKEQKAIRILLAVSIGIFCVAAFGGNIFFLFWKKLEESSHLQHLILLISLVLIAGGLWVYFATRNKPYERALVPLAATVYGSLILTIISMDIITPFQSTYEYAEFLKSRLKDSDRVAVFASPDKFSDLPFHLKRRIIVVGSDRGTLGDQAGMLDPSEQKAWFMSPGDLGDYFSEPSERIFCLVHAQKLNELQHEANLKKFFILKNDFRKVLISNRE